MKKAILFILFIASYNFLFAANYFFNGSTSANALANPANWGTDALGTIGSPANFSGVHNWTIANMPSNGFVSLTTTWILGGGGSKVIIGNGTGEVRLNISDAAGTGGTISGAIVDIAANTVAAPNNQNRLVFNQNADYSGITLGNLHLTSVVVYNASTGTQQILPNNSSFPYGSLWVNNTVTAQLTGTTQILINSQLQINNGGTLETFGTTRINNTFTTFTNGVGTNILKIGSTSATALTFGLTYNFTVSYNADANQTVRYGYFTNLIIEGGTGTQKIKT